MHYAYVLKNSTGKYYIGHSSKEPKKRVKEHNQSKSRWTKYKGPWKVIYSETFDTKEKAYKREQQIKRYKGGRAFKELIN